MNRHPLPIHGAISTAALISSESGLPASEVLGTAGRGKQLHPIAPGGQHVANGARDLDRAIRSGIWSDVSRARAQPIRGNKHTWTDHGTAIDKISHGDVHGIGSIQIVCSLE